MSQPRNTGQSKFIKILEERAQQERIQKEQSQNAEKNQSWMKKVFGATKKLSPEEIPDIDIKGQRYKRQSAAGVPRSQIERQLFKIGMVWFLFSP